MAKAEKQIKYWEKFMENANMGKNIFNKHCKNTAKNTMKIIGLIVRKSSISKKLSKYENPKVRNTRMFNSTMVTRPKANRPVMGIMRENAAVM
jgi:hypothetical protein